MNTTKRIVVGLLTVLCICVPVQAQNADWNVSYFEGESGKLITLPQCQLVSVTSDTLNVVFEGSSRSVRLFLLYELSRPNEENSFIQPIFIGTVIGGASGFMAGLFVLGGNFDKTDRVNSLSRVTAFFALVGAGLGLTKATDLEYTRYRFVEASNPEKRAVIVKIIEEEMVQQEKLVD